jgi:hypothetical protein
MGEGATKAEAGAYKWRSPSGDFGDADSALNPTDSQRGNEGDPGKGYHRDQMPEPVCRGSAAIAENYEKADT